MKYLLLFSVFLLVSCSRDIYELNIKYQDGKEELIRFEAHGVPHLDDGCIEFGFDENDDAVRCGVKSFTYKKLYHE
jgi:hypothetical protein